MEEILKQLIFVIIAILIFATILMIVAGVDPMRDLKFIAGALGILGGGIA